MYLKDVKHVSKGKRAKSCVSNCMEKVLFQVNKRWFRFLKSFWKVNKKIRKIIQKSFWYFPRLITWLSLWNEWLIKRGREKNNWNNGTYLISRSSITTPWTTNKCARSSNTDEHPTTFLFIDQREQKKWIKKICRDTRNKTFIHKKILQEEDVENDEKKKNENKQCEISATKDKPIQKELHEADTTKNKEFAKK